MALPKDAKARKSIPIYSGFVKYFPKAIVAVAELSQIGNDQHNPGAELFWDRSKSGDELDAQMRHILDEADGIDFDVDGVLHATKNAWRAMAALEKKLEQNGGIRRRVVDICAPEPERALPRGLDAVDIHKSNWGKTGALEAGMVTGPDGALVWPAEPKPLTTARLADGTPLNTSRYHP